MHIYLYIYIHAHIFTVHVNFRVTETTNVIVANSCESPTWQDHASLDPSWFAIAPAVAMAKHELLSRKRNNMPWLGYG